MSIALRQIRKEEYEAARALWDIVFPDDAAGYSAYYFSKRTMPEAIYAAFDGDRMVGDLHAVPYPLRFGKTVKPCAMVAGVATLPAYRHRGIAASLIRFAHDALCAKGVAAALLKPDVDFYEQFGYLPFAYHGEYELTGANAAHVETGMLITPTPAQMLSMYDAFAANFTGMMDRTLRDMVLYLEEAQLAGFAVTDGSSYAFCGEREDGVELSELVGQYVLPLVASLAKQHGSVRFRLPASMRVNGLEPASRMMFSMICPLDENNLLEGTGAANLETLLKGVTGPCCTLEFC